MFDNLKSLFIPNSQGNVYLGTTDAYNEQVMIPLQSGMTKNKFQNSDVDKVSVAMTCVKVLSNTFSRIPLKILDEYDTSNQNLKSDYRYKLLYYSPDGLITGQQFWMALEFNRLLKGNSFARIKRDAGTGRIKSLELIPSNKVGGYKKVRGQYYYTIYTTKDDSKDPKKEVVNADDMLHFRMDTRDGVWGMNPIEAIRLQLSKTWKRDVTEDTYFENNAFAPAVVKTTIPDAAFQKPFNEAMEQLKTMNAGPSGSGEWIKMPPFTEIQQLTLNSVDEKFINSSKFDAARIAGFFRVPPYMVGVYEYSKYSNLEHEQRNFQSTMSDVLFMYKREIEWKLFSMEELESGLYVTFDSKVLIDMDTDTKLNYYKTMKELGVLNADQIAEAEDLPKPIKIEEPKEPDMPNEEPDDDETDISKDASTGE